MKKKIFLSVSFFLLLVSCKNAYLVRNFQTELENSIEWANGTQFDISIKAEIGTGTLGVPEVASVKIHDTLDLVFTEGHGYTFVEWRVYKKSDTSIQVTDCITFKDPASSETKATVQKYDTDLLIMPYCVSKEHIKIDFVAEGCFITPTDSKIYYLGDEIQLTCTPNYGYSFLRWEVIDNTTQNVVNDVIKITQNDGVWTAKVQKSGYDVTLKGISGLRPKIVTKSPEHSQYLTTYQNESIYITFNQPMSRESLYYTREEEAKLPVNGQNLHRISYDELSCYGYTYNGVTVWKNISIIDLSDNNKNLLACYTKPEFVSDNIIVIPVNESNPPPRCSEIYIQISENMKSQTGLNMLAAEQWSYFITNESAVDNIPPALDLSLSSWLESGESDSNATNATTYPIINTIKSIGGNENYYFLNNNFFKIEATLTDSNSGIQDFKMELIPYCTEGGLLSAAPQEKKTIILKQGYGVKKLTYSNVTDISGYYSLSDYRNTSLCYKVKITGFDKAGNEVASPKTYYLILNRYYIPEVF